MEALLIFKLKTFLKASFMLLALQFTSFATSYSQEIQPITEFTNSGNSFVVDVSADNNNNAVAVFVDSVEIFASYSANGGIWQTPVNISNNSLLNIESDVDMDESGTAIAIWRTFDSGTFARDVRASIYSGGVWSLPVTIDAVDIFEAPAVAMDGTGKGLGVWQQGFPVQETHVSFFSGGLWSLPANIGVHGTFYFPSYSSSGNASVVWVNFNTGIYANNFDGSVWQGQVTLDVNPSTPDAGIDDNGNTIAVWTSSDDVVYSRFFGGSWSVPQSISTGPNNVFPKIAVAFDGTAVATWTDGSLNVVFNTFNGTTWGVTPITVAPGAQPTVSMDDQGNALIGYVSGLDIFAVLLPKNEVIGAAFLVATAPSVQDLAVDELGVALSDNASTGFLVWEQEIFFGEFGSDSFGTSFIFAASPPSPPLSITGTVCKNHFAMQTDKINILNFVPSTDPLVTAYYLRRNGKLIATIPQTGPYVYYDHNRCKYKTTYELTSVNAEDFESSPISVILN